MCPKCGLNHEKNNLAGKCTHNPNKLCWFCNNRIGYLSMSGPNVFSDCDCGYSIYTGLHWTDWEFQKFTKNFKRNHELWEVNNSSHN